MFQILEVCKENIPVQSQIMSVLSGPELFTDVVSVEYNINRGLSLKIKGLTYSLPPSSLICLKYENTLI